MALGPQAAPTAMPAISSPHPSLLLPKIPNKRPPPHPSSSVGRGSRESRRLGRKKSPAADLPARFCTSLEPRWKHTCGPGQVQRAQELENSLHMQRQRPPLGSAVCWSLAHRRVRQSLTLGDHSSWAHSARTRGGGAERTSLRGGPTRTWGCPLIPLGFKRARGLKSLDPLSRHRRSHAQGVI